MRRYICLFEHSWSRFAQGLLIVGGIALASFSFGASSSPSRTIEQTVALALEKGLEESIQPPLSTNLGFTGATKGKILSYPQDKTPDGLEHQFNLIFDAQGNPKWIVWGNTSARDRNGRIYVDGWKFRTTLDGNLVSAVRSMGLTGEIVQKQLDIKSRKIRNAYKKERDFLLATAVDLEFEIE